MLNNDLDDLEDVLHVLDNVQYNFENVLHDLGDVQFDLNTTELTFQFTGRARQSRKIWSYLIEFQRVQFYINWFLSVLNYLDLM